MDNKELLKLQQTQYSMLKEVTQICEQEKIQYSLAYGTLLGAVRHKGTIPWDYDIDIFIKRKDVKKFVESLNKYLPKNLFWEKLCAGDIMYCDEIRIYKKNTALYLPSHFDEKVNNCIRIDVFILDYAKDNLFFAKKLVPFLYIAKLNKYEKDWLYDIHKGHVLKTLYIKIGDFIHKFITEDKFEKIIYNLVVSKQKSDNVCVVKYPDKAYKAQWFENFEKMQYENSQFYCISNYDDFLKLKYGDYMKLPPEDQRFTDKMREWVVYFSNV